MDGVAKYIIKPYTVKKTPATQNTKPSEFHFDQRASRCLAGDSGSFSLKGNGV